MTPAERRAALELEADRIKGRLDELDQQLRGEPAWLDFAVNLPETVAEVTVDRLLNEARQNALALATIVRVLDGTASKSEAPAAGKDPADEVKRKREEKMRQAAQGSS